MPTEFENLETLRKAAWESIATRREFEWRVSLAFWSLLAAFIAGVVTNKIPDVPCVAKLALSLFPLVLGFAHCRWLFGLNHAYDIDKQEEGDFRKAMRFQVPTYYEDALVTKWRNEILDRKKEPKTLRTCWTDWNLCSQLLMTIALTVLAVSSLWLPRPNETPHLAPQPTCVTVPQNVPK